MFTGRVVVVTGGAHGIGKTIQEEFGKFGAHVCVIDLRPNDYFVGDIGEKAVLEDVCQESAARIWEGRLFNSQCTRRCLKGSMIAPMSSLIMHCELE